VFWEHLEVPKTGSEKINAFEMVAPTGSAHLASRWLVVLIEVIALAV
jgi:hypothetical protein